MTKTSKNILFCICSIIGTGILTFYNFSIKNIELLVGFIVFLFLYIIFRKTKIAILFIIFIFIILGILRVNFSKIDKNNENKIWYFNQEEKSINSFSIVGVISQIPDKRINYQKLTVSTSKIINLNKDVSGKLLVTVSLYPEYKYGDEIQFDCVLQSPKQIENFKYDKYLMKENIYSVCRTNEIQLLNPHKGNLILEKIYTLRETLFAQADKIWPEPTSSFVNGLLFGKRIISEDINSDFKKVGISHIIVVSGMHVTIISLVTLQLLISAGLNRKQSFIIVVLILIGFTILSGLGASTIRATIMGIILLFSQNIERIVKKSLILSYSAIIMSLMNPYTIFYDVGFQLSFFATYGLLYITPIIERSFDFLPEKFEIRSSLVSSTAATISTTPILIYQFKQISSVSLISNLLILPLISINMAVSFISIIFSCINLNLARILGFFNYCSVKLMMLIASSLSEIKFSYLAIKSFSLLLLIISYIGIFSFVFIKNPDYAFAMKKRPKTKLKLQQSNKKIYG